VPDFGGGGGGGGDGGVVAGSEGDGGLVLLVEPFLPPLWARDLVFVLLLLLPVVVLPGSVFVPEEPVVPCAKDRLAPSESAHTNVNTFFIRSPLRGISVKVLPLPGREHTSGTIVAPSSGILPRSKAFLQPT